MAAAVWVSTVFNGYGNKYFEEPIDAVSFDERDLMDLERIISISQEVHLQLYFALSAGETQISSGFHESCRRV